MSQGPRTSLKIRLSREDQEVLEAWQRSTLVPALSAMRGRVILLLAAGNSVTQTAQIAGPSRQLTYKWARRLVAKGIAGLARTSRRTTPKRPVETKKPVQVPVHASNWKH